MPKKASATLSQQQRDDFVQKGLARLDNAFPQEVAQRTTDILWRETGCDPKEPRTWLEPVVRIGGRSDPPFVQAANTPRLLSAYDEIVGEERWIPRDGLGTFPVRFPHKQDPGDTGWHVDASFPPTDDVSSFFDWRVNVFSRGRGLLMLFLLSDVSELDAPTRVRVGSHVEVARLLAPYGSDGLRSGDLAAISSAATAGLPEVAATGAAGTVYLCHPFIVHAAQPHRGKAPRFMAQPPLVLKEPCVLNRTDGTESLLERSIREALAPSTVAAPSV